MAAENQFDFGPLVVGKNPADKHKFNNSNSSLFRISNQGKFDCHVSFALMSSVVETDPLYSKNVFFVEPEEMTIKMNDVPQEIRVWAIPDQPQKFKDELIVMVKDNPIPLILPITCLGQKPEIEVIEGQQLSFDRLLLNQTMIKHVKLKNVSAINVKWKLKDYEELPEEFSV